MVRVVRTPGKGAEQLRIALDNMQDKVGRVGYFENSKYEDGTSVAYVATIQEYGSPAQGIPPRPTMRPTVANNWQSWKAISAQAAKSIIRASQALP